MNRGEKWRHFSLHLNPFQKIRSEDGSELQTLVRRFNNGEPAEESWRFVNRKDTKIGDRVFLLLQGKSGPAIIGYGRINGHPRKISGTPQIPIRFEGLVDPSAQTFATREELFVIEGGERFWRIQSSGVKLENKVAAELEKLIVGRSPKALAHQSADHTYSDYVALLTAVAKRSGLTSPEEIEMVLFAKSLPLVAKCQHLVG